MSGHDSGPNPDVLPNPNPRACLSMKAFSLISVPQIRQAMHNPDHSNPEPNPSFLKDCDDLPPLRPMSFSITSSSSFPMYSVSPTVRLCLTLTLSRIS